MLWLGAAGAIYGLLVASSSGLRLFVVYGRLTRQLVPFLCLATACAAAEWAAGWLLKRERLAVAGAGLAAMGFAQPLAQRFPLDFQAQACAIHGGLFTEATTIEGTWEWPLIVVGGPSGGAIGGDGPQDPQRYVLLNARFFYLVYGSKAPPDGETVIGYRHPFEFQPYLYEGLEPEARAIVRATDISMRLLDTQVRP